MPKKSNTEEFIKKAHEIHGNEYDYSLVDYKNNTTKVKIICPVHGIFEQTPKRHLSGCGCYKCANVRNGNKTKKTTDQFIEEAKKIHGDRYDYSKVNYINNAEKVCITCKKHGDFWQEPYSHLRGNGCPICNTRLSTTKDFIKKAKKIHGDRYDYSKVDYKNSAEKVCITCKKHGDFWQIPANHLVGNGCPVCNESKGERKISLFLEENNIFFEPQKKFEECRSKLPLPFDFYLPELNTAIEFDGRQHYAIIDFFGGEEGFEKRNKYDKIKNSFCKENNIELIRISFKDFNNIEKILSNKLFTKK